MSSSRGSSSLIAAAAMVTLAGGCASGTDNTAAGSASSSPFPSPRSSATVRPLTAAELAAALPEEGSLPGYTIDSAPETTTTAGGSTDEAVRPTACRPLHDARSGALAASVATARVHISATGSAPPTETVTFTSYRPGGAAAHIASLDKALDACPSLSFLNRYGDRVSLDVEPVADQVAVGDAAVSFRTHSASDIGGFTSDADSLITIIRSGNATITVVSDSIIGSQLSTAKKRAFLPKLDQQLLKRQADALRQAQRG